ncbi:5275_t:CDS:2 [Entrophospora sp. SA101]|nr:5647_t:CDS:2 [Entrophospora sp. SA101]CAJ0750833.1 5275_t:CDS:2 [Entrophospora sp. SA101]
MPNTNKDIRIKRQNGNGIARDQRKGGVKYRRKTFKENIQGITKPAIRRLTRRGGVRRISELVYEETRSDTVTYTEYARCKTVTSLDVG